MATNATPRPTGVKSNIVKGLPRMSARTLETMMLGEVPTSVTRPPVSDAKAIGISNAEGEVLWRRATCMAIGMKIASAPTFLVTIDRTSTQPASAGTWMAVVRRRGNIGRIMASTTPERAMPLLTTSAAPTMMMISSEKPSKAWF